MRRVLPCRDDHTSVLRMIEERWSLPPLTVRDQNATSLARALTSKAATTAPHYDVPTGPFGGACGTPPTGTPPSSEREWEALRDVAAGAGWPV
jgi:phospholipase C